MTTEIKFNGTPKQAKWAASILDAANLSEEQVDNLLWWAGLTMCGQHIMDAELVIDNRHNLAWFADAMGVIRKMTPDQRRQLAAEAAAEMAAVARSHLQ